MKIVIFGANGNLGSQLVEVFSGTRDRANPLEENEVIAWDKAEIDVTDRDLVMKKIRDVAPGLVLNAVGYNAVDNCETDEGYEDALKLNQRAVETIAQACLETGAIMVHFSTDYVFSGENQEGYAEDSQTAPIQKYGESKRLGEEAIIRLSGKGLRWYLIRVSKLFGPCGSSPSCKPSFFDTMLKLAETKNELDVVDEEVSCFTYTVDLAQATKVLIDEDYGYGIYHMVNSEAVTWYGAAQALFRIAGKEIRLNPVSSEKFPRPAKRPKYSVLLNTKFIPLRSFKEALSEFIQNQDPRIKNQAA